MITPLVPFINPTLPITSLPTILPVINIEDDVTQHLEDFPQNHADVVINEQEDMKTDR